MWVYKSLASSLLLLTSGRTTACLNIFGKQLAANDSSNITVTNGAKSPRISFTMHVGTGCNSMATCVHWSTVGVVRNGMLYGGVDAVDVWTLSTLLKKKAAKPSAVWVLVWPLCSSASRPCSLCHSRFILPLLAAISVRQYLSLLCSYTASISVVFFTQFCPSTSMHIRLKRRSALRALCRVSRQLASNHGVDGLTLRRGFSTGQCLSSKACQKELCVYWNMLRLVLWSIGILCVGILWSSYWHPM